MAHKKRKEPLYITPSTSISTAIASHSPPLPPPPTHHCHRMPPPSKWNDLIRVLMGVYVGKPIYIPETIRWIHLPSILLYVSIVSVYCTVRKYQVSRNSLWSTWNSLGDRWKYGFKTLIHISIERYVVAFYAASMDENANGCRVKAIYAVIRQFSSSLNVCDSIWWVYGALNGIFVIVVAVSEFSPFLIYSGDETLHYLYYNCRLFSAEAAGKSTSAC